jgi:hypothetical protein
MKTITLILFAATLLVAQDRPVQDGANANRDRANNAAQPNKAANSAADSQSIPKNAVEIEPNLYRLTDANGKNWMYRRTPFGISKWEDKPVPQTVVDDGPPVIATDLGDSVRFERQTPFGVSKWVSKKSALTDDEKAWFARMQRVAGSARTSSKTAETH